jgi:hypothetical protein
LSPEEALSAKDRVSELQRQRRKARREAATSTLPVEVRYIYFLLYFIYTDASVIIQTHEDHTEVAEEEVEEPNEEEQMELDYAVSSFNDGQSDVIVVESDTEITSAQSTSSTVNVTLVDSLPRVSDSSEEEVNYAAVSSTFYTLKNIKAWFEDCQVCVHVKIKL